MAASNGRKGRYFRPGGRSVALIVDDQAARRLIQATFLTALKDAKHGDQMAAFWVREEGVLWLRATGWDVDQAQVEAALVST